MKKYFKTGTVKANNFFRFFEAMGLRGVKFYHR
jgi:hypothetical protein